MRRLLPIFAGLICLAALLSACSHSSKSVTPPEPVIPGYEWASAASPTNMALYAVTGGPHKWVAVGFKGAMVIADSSSVWINGSSGTTRDLYDVAANDSGYVATGSGSRLIHSSDGVYWHGATIDAAHTMQAVTWYEHTQRFVAANDSGASALSADGIQWTTAATGESIMDVAAYDTLILAVGSHASILTSTDGLSWTLRRWTDPPLYSDLFGAVVTPYLFVAVGAGGAIITSGSGTDWTKRPTGQTDSLNAIAWSGDNFVAVGNDGLILVSPSGIVWTQVNSGTNRDLNDVTFYDGAFVAVGDGGTILTSPPPQETDQ